MFDQSCDIAKVRLPQQEDVSSRLVRKSMISEPRRLGTSLLVIGHCPDCTLYISGGIWPLAFLEFL